MDENMRTRLEISTKTKDFAMSIKALAFWTVFWTTALEDGDEGTAGAVTIELTTSGDLEDSSSEEDMVYCLFWSR